LTSPGNLSIIRTKEVVNMFHAKEGWHFERTGTDNVTITVQPAGYNAPVAKVTIGTDMWASIVAAVATLPGQAAENIARLTAEERRGR
jgi:hypothetical protein